MNTRRLRSWLNGCKLFFLFFCLFHFDSVVDDVLGWRGRAVWLIVLFGYCALLAFLLKKRAMARAILRALAWENKAAFSPLLNTILIYGILMLLSLPLCLILKLTGIMPSEEWHCLFISQSIGIALWTLVFRVGIWLTLPG